MKIVNFNNEVIESWWALLRHLSAEVRLELASRLINSLKPTEAAKEKGDKDWKKLYGAWAEEKENAEDLISLIRDSRFVNRQIESLD